MEKRKQQYERQKVYVKYIFRLFVKTVREAFDNIANILVSFFKSEKPAFHGEHEGMSARTKIGLIVAVILLISGIYFIFTGLTQ